MAENEQTQQNQNQAVGEGLVPSQSDELTTIKAQLEQAEVARNEANQAKAALEEAAAGKDSRIAELQAEGEALRAERSNLEASLSEANVIASEAKQTSEASATELATIKEARDQAVTKYLDMAKALNPNIPEGIIGGETIGEIDSSIEKGKAIVEAVKKAMETEAAATRVPAGAPTRGAISIEGMSPKEKIAYAIQPK